MANHRIDVSFVTEADGEHVRAIPNTFVSPVRTNMKPGDTVTWFMDPPSRNLQVLFKQKVEPLPDNPSPPFASNLLKPVGPMGPFSSLSLGGGMIHGTVNSDVSADAHTAQRFVYDLFEDGRRLTWATGANDGGIDIPRTPP